MDLNLFLVAFIILVALAFDYTNGMHDAANSISTIVSTRVLTPKQAILWAAFFNFIAFLIFGTTVAKTIGSGMIDISIVTPIVGRGNNIKLSAETDRKEGLFIAITHKSLSRQIEDQLKKRAGRFFLPALFPFRLRFY